MLDCESRSKQGEGTGGHGSRRHIGHHIRALHDLSARRIHCPSRLACPVSTHGGHLATREMHPGDEQIKRVIKCAAVSIVLQSLITDKMSFASAHLPSGVLCSGSSTAELQARVWTRGAGVSLDFAVSFIRH